MHQRFFFALVALALSGVTVYGQQAVRNPKKEQVICDSLAAVVPGAVEAFRAPRLRWTTETTSKRLIYTARC